MEKIKQALQAAVDTYDRKGGVAPVLTRNTLQLFRAALSEMQRSKPKEPPRYVMSKDYEALYELLCNGGEALGTCLDVDEGECVGTLITDAEIVDGEDHFIAECTRLNLEWIAVEPPKEQGAEPVKVGCFGDDGLVRVHGKDETCDVCASPTSREKAMEEAGDAMDELLDGPWHIYDENREKAIAVWRAAKSTK